VNIIKVGHIYVVSVDKMSLDYDDPGCLRVVAGRGRGDLCRLLLQAQTPVTLTTNERRIDPNYIDAVGGVYGTTAIHDAIRWSDLEEDDHHRIQGFLEVVGVLIWYGADVSAVNEDGSTPLHAAIRYAPSIEFLNIILNAHPRDLNPKYEGETPLLMAVHNALHGVGNDYAQLYKEQVDALLRCGVDVHTVDNLGNSVLHQKGINEWLLQKFLAVGVDINRRGNGGRTPLHQAVYRGRLPPRHHSDYTDRLYVANVAMFLAAGVDIDIKDDRGQTAQELADNYHGDDHPVYELLRKNRIFRMESRLALVGKLMELIPLK
jgi:ankyrin repeat protein